MGNLAAVLVLVACPTNSATCLAEPVRVVSYESAIACRAHQQDEMRKASFPGFKIYGTCNSVDDALLAGKPQVNIKRDARLLVSKTVNDDPPPRAFTR